MGRERGHRAQCTKALPVPRLAAPLPTHRQRQSTTTAVTSLSCSPCFQPLPHAKVPIKTNAIFSLPFQTVVCARFIYTHALCPSWSSFRLSGRMRTTTFTHSSDFGSVDPGLGGIFLIVWVNPLSFPPLQKRVRCVWTCICAIASRGMS